LLSVVDDADYRQLYIFAKETGLRREELVNLCWTDIEQEGSVRFLHVQSHPEEFTVKNAYSNRLIPLSDKALKALEYWQAISKGKYIFYGRKGKRRCKYALSKSFTRYVQRAPGTVNKELTLHHLRHTFATKLFHAGEPLGLISRWLGHSDISTTERHYIHQYKEGLGECAARMNEREAINQQACTNIFPLHASEGKVSANAN
jgi:integrase